MEHVKSIFETIFQQTLKNVKRHQFTERSSEAYLVLTVAESERDGYLARLAAAICELKLPNAHRNQDTLSNLLSAHAIVMLNYFQEIPL